MTVFLGVFIFTLHPHTLSTRDSTQAAYNNDDNDGRYLYHFYTRCVFVCVCVRVCVRVRVQASKHYIPTVIQTRVSHIRCVQYLYVICLHVHFACKAPLYIVHAHRPIISAVLRTIEIIIIETKPPPHHPIYYTDTTYFSRHRLTSYDIILLLLLLVILL